MPRRRLYRSNAERQSAYRQRLRKRLPVYLRHQSDEWETPPDLFRELDQEFGFKVDLAALPHNTKCPQFYSPADDSLKQNWEGVCWLNPPYGVQLLHWMRKAHESAQRGATVVCLVPARTDSRWWHDYALPHGEIRYIKRRLKFNGAATSAPFASVVVIFRSKVFNASGGTE